MAHQPLTAILGLQVRVGGQKARHLRLHCLGKQCMRSRAQHVGQQIGKRPWLDKLQNVSVGHGVSLLRWRSGGSNTPTIRRLIPSFRHQLLRRAPSMLTNGDVVSRGGSRTAARSNIQAGTSSHRSAAEPLNVQRKTTPSALSTAS